MSSVELAPPPGTVSRNRSTSLESAAAAEVTDAILMVTVVARPERPRSRPDRVGRRIRSARRNERQRVRQEGGKRAAQVRSAENDGEISRLGLRKAIPVDGQRVTLQRLECERRI